MLLYVCMYVSIVCKKVVAYAKTVCENSAYSDCWGLQILACRSRGIAYSESDLTLRGIDGGFSY